MRELEDRFWSKVDRSGGEDACWPWLASKMWRGYGQFHLDGTVVRAHRLAYQLVKGAIPKELQLDHSCHDPRLCRVGEACPHRACCNPRHLQLSTQANNRSADRAVRASHNALKTQCIHGHPFDEANTYVTPYGARQCRTCNRKRAKESAGRARAKA